MRVSQGHFIKYILNLPKYVFYATTLTILGHSHLYFTLYYLKQLCLQDSIKNLTISKPFEI